MDAKRYDELREAVQSADDRTRPKALRELTSYLLDEGFSHVTAVAPQYLASRSSLVGLRLVCLGSLVVTDAKVA